MTEIHTIKFSNSFQSEFVGVLKQEFFGSYEAPKYIVENNFNVDGIKVSMYVQIHEDF